MVSVDDDLITKEIRSKLLHRVQDRKQLLFICWVVLLCLIQCSTSIVDHY